MHAFRLFPRLAAVLGSIAIAACATRAPAADTHAAESGASRTGGCHSRVIVSFAQDAPESPDERFVKDLAHATRVDLTYVSAIAPGLYLFNLSATDADSGCHEALERLRRDSRVRSADIDTRRQHQ